MWRRSISLMIYLVTKFYPWKKNNSFLCSTFYVINLRWSMMSSACSSNLLYNRFPVYQLHTFHVTTVISFYPILSWAIDNTSFDFHHLWKFKIRDFNWEMGVHTIPSLLFNHGKRTIQSKVLDKLRNHALNVDLIFFVERRQVSTPSK